MPLFSQRIIHPFRIGQVGSKGIQPILCQDAIRNLVWMDDTFAKEVFSRDCKGQEESVRAAGPHSVLVAVLCFTFAIASKDVFP